MTDRPSSGRAAPGAPCRRFSVVVPTCDRAEQVQKAVGDVLAQDIDDFEIVVVVDGEPEPTVSALADVPDARVRVVVQPNGGPSAARNAGARVARGEWLVFLDDDDRVDPEWLSVFAEHSDDPDVAIVCCGTLLVDSGGSVSGVWRPRELGRAYGSVRALWAPATFAVRTKAFEAVGGYDEALRFGENFELGMRLGAYCRDTPLRIASDDRPMVRWRRDPTSRRIRADDALVRYESARHLLDKHGARYRSDRHERAATLGVAGVNAARLGDLRNARRYLLRAAWAGPFDWRSWVRLVVSLSRRSAAYAWAPPSP